MNGGNIYFFIPFPIKISFRIELFIGLQHNLMDFSFSCGGFKASAG